MGRNEKLLLTVAALTEHMHLAPADGSALSTDPAECVTWVELFAQFRHGPVFGARFRAADLAAREAACRVLILAADRGE